MTKFYSKVRLRRDFTGSKLTINIEYNYYPKDLEEICSIVDHYYPDWDIDYLEIYQGVPPN